MPTTMSLPPGPPSLPSDLWVLVFGHSLSLGEHFLAACWPDLKDIHPNLELPQWVSWSSQPLSQSLSLSSWAVVSSQNCLQARHKDNDCRQSPPLFPSLIIPKEAQNLSLVGTARWSWWPHETASPLLLAIIGTLGKWSVHSMKVVRPLYGTGPSSLWKWSVPFSTASYTTAKS